MRILITFILCVGAAFADLKTSGKAFDTLNWYTVKDSSVGGDTPHFTAWTGSGNGGNFSGGRIYGTANDAHGWCASGGNIFFLEMTTLDWTTKTNTAISCVNGMSGYGGSGTVNVPAGWTGDGYTWKSYNPWAYNSDLFWMVYRQLQSGPYSGAQSTVLTSPDKGLHWCNTVTYASLLVSTHLGVVGCDSGNWSATGDAPADNTKMAFGAAGSSANPLARPMAVQFCQDNTCTGGPFDSDNYLYFVTMDGAAKLYAACVAKSKNSIMDPTQWWYWKGGNATCSNTGSWTHTAGSAVEIQRQGTSGADSYGYPSSVIYVAQAGLFLMTSYDESSRSLYATSAYPWGPFKRIAPLGATANEGNFVATNIAWLNASCATCNTNPGRWELTTIGSITGLASDLSFMLERLYIVNGGPSTPNTPPAGKNTLGRLPIRISKDGLNKTLIGSGLRFATLFDDYIDYPSAAFAGYANMYTRDLLGSTTCLAGGQNAAGGAVVFGAQNSTASLSYGTAGLHLGDQYMSQLHSNAGNCSFTLPSTMSGNSSFTVITVLAMDVVSKQQGMIWELQPIGSGAAHNGVSFGTNINVEGGSHVDVYDNNVTLRTNPGLTAGQYNMITYVKSAGAFQTTSTVYFGDGSGTKKWCNSGCGSGWNFVSGTDSGTLNLSSSAVLTLNCATFASATQCKNGGTNSPSQGILSGTFSFFAIYDRALSATEVAQNYRVIKAALAQAPRSITVQ